MPFPTLRRTALPLVLLFTLAVPAAHAAPRARGTDAVTTPWAEIARWWIGLAAWWARLDGGCMIDPGGLCLQGAPEGLDGGCKIDPSGNCLQGAPEGLDGGCKIDPDGCAGQQGRRLL